MVLELYSDSEDATPSMTDKRKPRGIQSIVIGFNILERLADAPTPMGLKSLSDATNMPASKLRFYLVSFLDLGLVSQDAATGRYNLGPAALKLGLSALEKVDVIRMIRDEMATLAETLGFTVFVAVWGTHGPTIIDRVDGRNRTVLEIRVGSVLPLTSSAVGQIFTAFMPRAATSALLQRERRQIVRAKAQHSESQEEISYKEIRATRFAWASGTLLAGFTAIASPVLDRAGLPLAALSIVGPIGQMKDTHEGTPAHTLLELTTRLSQQLGWDKTTPSK